MFSFLAAEHFSGESNFLQTPKDKPEPVLSSGEEVRNYKQGRGEDRKTDCPPFWVGFGETWIDLRGDNLCIWGNMN